MSRRLSNLEYKINQLKQEKKELVEVLKRERREFVEVLPEDHKRDIKQKHSVLRQRLAQIKPELEILTEKYQNLINEKINDLSQSFEALEIPLQRTPLRPSLLSKNIDQSGSAAPTTAEHAQVNMHAMSVAQDPQQNVELATNVITTAPQAQQNVELVTTHTVPIVAIQQNVEIEPTAQDVPTISNTQIVETATAATGAISKNSKIIETGTISKNLNSKTVETCLKMRKIFKGAPKGTPMMHLLIWKWSHFQKGKSKE